MSNTPLSVPLRRGSFTAEFAIAAANGQNVLW